MDTEIKKVRKLVGNVSQEQLKFVDRFVSDNVGLFMPVGGACFYSLTPSHTHPSYMFCIPFDDQTSVSVGGKTIKAAHGKVFALSPGIPHHELPSESPPRYIAVFISKGFFENQLKHYASRNIYFKCESFDAGPGLMPLLKRFMLEADNGMQGFKAVLDALCIEICHSIIRSALKLNPLHDRISHRVEIDRAVEYMHSNLSGKITVEKLAEAAHMSETHFSRTFKSELGSSPMEYLARIRMERVKKLLLAGEKSVTEIALECGFSSPAYLSACFRKLFNISPTDYGKRLKKVPFQKKLSVF